MVVVFRNNCRRHCIADYRIEEPICLHYAEEQSGPGKFYRQLAYDHGVLFFEVALKEYCPKGLARLPIDERHVHGLHQRHCSHTIYELS